MKPRYLTALLFFSTWTAAMAAALPAPVAVQGGGELRLIRDKHATAVLLRTGEGKVVQVTRLGGAYPEGLARVDLRRDGRPEVLASLSEEGSGGYGFHVLFSEDGKTVLWRSASASGAAARINPARTGVHLDHFVTSGLQGGDLLISEPLELTAKQEVTLGSPDYSRARTGSHLLTSGLDALQRGKVTQAEYLLTRAIDSPEGHGALIGAPARLHLARALLLSLDGAKARAILLGARKRFPASPLRPEIDRMLSLFDRTYRSQYEPLRLLLKAQLQISRGHYRKAIATADRILKTYPESGLSDEAHVLMGQAYASLDDRRAAVRHYQKVVLYFPNSPLAPLAGKEVSRLDR